MDFVFFTHVRNYSDLLYLIDDKTGCSSVTQDSYDKRRELLNEFCSRDIVLNDIVSISDKSVKSSGIVKFLPFLPSQIVVNETMVLALISSLIAEYKLSNVKLVGLGGLLSTIGDRGEALSRQHDIFVSSGNSLTSYLSVESIIKLVEEFQIPPELVNVLIVGATGDIAHACFNLLAKKFRNFILFGRNLAKLQNAYKYDCLNKYLNINLTTKLDDSLKNSHIIVSATSSPLPLMDIASISPGTIICDISYPSSFLNLDVEYTNKILLFEGGKVHFQPGENIHHPLWHKCFPDNIIFGCLAEILAVSLEKNFSDVLYKNRRVAADSCKVIYDKARKHGFSLSPYVWQGYRYSTVQIKNIISVLQERCGIEVDE